MSDFNPGYLVALDEIFHSHWAARRRFRIQLLARAIEQLWPKGHPTRFIHITGTNGKGSVAHYIAQGIGLFARCGAWTGPHVFDYAERITLDGAPASHDQIAKTWRERVRPIQDRLTREATTLTFAECGILLALCLFEQAGMEWAVMEVGNGGRYTPLMALTPSACVLTNVGNDHPKSLGQQLWQRALEKAGLARANTPFFTAAIEPALSYVLATAQAEGAETQVIGETEASQIAASEENVRAPHVLINKALAVAVVRHFYPGAQPAQLTSAMELRPMARFWQPEPGLVVDVAHNVDKMARFVEELVLHFPEERFHFLLGLSRSRDPREIFAPLLPLAASICFTSTGHAGQPPRQLAEQMRGLFPEVCHEEDPVAALARLKALGTNPIVVTGSAYMIDLCFNPNPYVRETNASYGRRYRQPGAGGLGDQMGDSHHLVSHQSTF